MARTLSLYVSGSAHSKRNSQATGEATAKKSAHFANGHIPSPNISKLSH